MNFGIGNVILTISIICLLYGIVVLVMWGNEDVSTERYDTLNAMSTPAFIIAVLGFFGISSECDILYYPGL